MSWTGLFRHKCQSYLNNWIHPTLSCCNNFIVNLTIMDIIMYPRHSIIWCVLVKGGPVQICTPTQRYYSKLAIYRRFIVQILLHPLSVWLTTAASEFTAQSMITREIVSGVTAGDCDTQSTRSYALWSKIQYFLLDNEIKYVICKMTAILSQPQCV